jgi:amino acid adenylation domain-containing protein
MRPKRSPIEGYREALQRAPEATALEIEGRSWSYAELARWAGGLARAVRDHDPERTDRVGLVAVYAARSLTMYGGSLAVFGAGRAHLALSPSHPVARCANILGQADCRTLVVGNEALEQLPALLALAPQVSTVLVPERADLQALADAHPSVRFLDAAALAPAELAAPAPNGDDLAYLVFTSGSTGAPKGVAITHGNLAVYMRNFEALAGCVPGDRVATTYELVFDIALHDMFQAWWAGATLCVVPARQLAAPGRFIRKQRITVWFSVASVAMLLRRQGALRPGVFPLLRISLLCGEPLPVASAEAWAAAAPNSALYNVYGPTETTMEMSFYRWHEGSAAECRRGVVPIGIPFPDHQHLLLDDDGRVVEGAGCGELLLSGPQVGPGYWGLPEKNAETFVQLPDRPGRWYRTGDRVERDEGGMYHFMSRLDFMVKVRGHRIELGEVEAAARAVLGTDLVVVLPWPEEEGAYQGLVAVAAGAAERPWEEVRDALAERLPGGWIPDRLVRVEALPLNTNRKIDRGALRAILGG